MRLRGLVNPARPIVPAFAPLLDSGGTTKGDAARMVKAALWGAGLLALVAAAGSARADDIADKIDAARQANGRGDTLKTLAALQAAEASLAAKLVEQFARVMPPAPNGWDASAPESEPLDAVGGGLTVTRGYQNNDAVLSATLTVDNPSVANSAALFQPGPGTAEPGFAWRAVKVGAETAMLRFDSANGEGEIVLVIQSRAALQIEGSNIASEQILTDAAQGWNLALLHKLLGV